MISIDMLQDVLISMITALFFAGLISFIIGIVILIARSGSKELKILAKQSTQLAQKGFAEEVAGLVGNASSLLTATNELIKTTAGIGVFLTLLGVTLMIVACILALKFI
jgi:hypothetical protein